VDEDETPTKESWIAKHGSAVLVGVLATVIGGVILYFVVGYDGSSQPVVIRAGATGPATEQPSEPEDFSEAVAARPFWTSSPFLAKDESTAERPEYGERSLPFDQYSYDLVVAKPKALVEDPNQFEGRKLILVGKVLEQQDVSGRFIHHEFRASTGNPDYDLYVVTGRYGFAETGEPTLIIGQLAAAGYTQDPAGKRHRSVYIDARSGNVKGLFSASEIGSKAIRTAYEEVASR
jgi:hypothetical protein